MSSIAIPPAAVDIVPPSAFDHGCEQQMRDPYPAYAAFRSQCPVAHSDQYGGFYFVSRYQDVKRVFSDYAQFTSVEGVSIPTQPLRMYPIDLDPPRQTQFRKVLNRFFTMEAVARHTGFIQGIVDGLIDGFIEHGHADFAAQFVRPILPAVILPLLGVPIGDADYVIEQIDILTRRHKFEAAQILDAHQKIAGYLLQLIARRRATAPCDDVITLLMETPVGGAALTDEDIFRTITIILFGGLDTTTAVMLEAFLLLGKSPEQKCMLLAMPDWTPAIEELVRFTSPVQGLRRTVKHGVTLKGVELEPGAPILALLGAANRDPDVFEAPDSCQFSRSGNEHLGFGAGAHICLGRHLARLELKIALRTVLDRLPDFCVEQDFQPDYVAGETRGMKTLPVRFTPGKRNQKG